MCENQARRLEMHLKEIVINGFKSFPEKTVVKINSELTAVVGPNGSGKSNISDAFKWVMGEQSPKTLRGSKMEDVIFAGTETRKPLGYAEVDLIFDNSSNRLALPYTEVSVKRRLYRSGESEYLLNNKGVRLKEIKELFMDTGIGIDGYSIIGQGRVEDIISVKSEIRRKVIEEAAGIVKYKTRKDEAIKKLEKTKENIDRLEDIIQEIAYRIGPLKKQKECAQLYLNYKSDLKNRELNLFSREYEKSKVFLDSLQNQLEMKQRELENEKKVLKKNNAGFEELIEALKGAEVEKKNLEEKLNNIQSDFFDNKSQLNVFDEKIIFYGKEQERINENIRISENLIGELNSECDKFKVEASRIQQSIDRATLELEKYNKELNAFLESSSHNLIRIDEEKNEIYVGYNQQTELKSRLNTLDALLENVEQRKFDLAQEKREIDEISEKTSIQINQMAKQRTASTEALESNKVCLEKMRDKFRQVEILMSNADQESKKIEYKINQSSSRKDFVMRLQDEYGGYFKSVQDLMVASKRVESLKKSVVGVVAELIETDSDYEKSLKVALGSALQFVVIKNEKQAGKVIEFLKSKNIGRVTLLPLDTIKARGLTIKEKKALNVKGCLGTLNTYLKYDHSYSNIIDFLLGRVILADNIHNALSISKVINYSAKIVTLEGEVINTGGAITGGTIRKSGNNLLNRNKEIREIEAELNQYNKELSSCQLEKKQHRDSRDKCTKEIEIIKTKCSQIEKTTVELTSTIKHKEEEIAQIKKNQLKLKENIDYLNTENRRYKSEKEAIEEDLKHLHIKIKRQEQDLDDKNSHYKNIQEEIETLKQKVSDKRIEISERANRILTVKNEIASKERAIHEQNMRIDENNKQKEDLSETIASIETEIQRLNIENERLTLKMTEHKTELNHFNHIQAEKQEKIYDYQKQINNSNRMIGELDTEINRIILKIESAESKLLSLTEGIWEEYETNYAMSLDFRDDSISLNKLNNDVKEIKRKIKVLGDINLNAIEEYRQVNERFMFLTNQSNDLNEAKAKLEGIIKDLTVKMKKQFEEEYQKIRHHFKNVFLNLFNGGKADIVLTDEQDALNSDIEIYAQPPGKALNKISLLSGGEKALTAIALLFAILKTNPTPFCILDEIEAALDDANVHRFARYLKDFSKETQFLVITHRKGTMEYVDTLYGATMEELGVTKLIAIQLSDYSS